MFISYDIPVTEVAEYFLQKLEDEAGDCISNLKLQKLVYYAQGFVLAIKGQTLFNDNIVAWQHGPVVVALYNGYKNHEANCIPKPSKYNSNLVDNFKDITEILDDVYNTYGQFSAWRLRDMTHQEKPWAESNINDVISLVTMEQYFKTLLI